MSHKGSKFIRHNISLLRMRECLAHTTWFKSWLHRMFCDRIKLFGFVNLIHGTSGHRMGSLWLVRRWVGRHRGSLDHWLGRSFDGGRGFTSRSDCILGPNEQDMTTCISVKLIQNKWRRSRRNYLEVMEQR